MTTLFHEPEAPEDALDPGAPTPSEADAPAPVERPCSTCGAPLAEGQEWCLECGTPATDAARVRGGLPGWRTAAAVIAVTLVMASGAVAAAYAAMRSDNSSPTAAPTQTTAQTATVPQPAAIDIPAETPAATTPATGATASAATPAPVTPPAAAAPLPTATPAPTATPPASTPTPTPAPTTSTPAQSDTTGKSQGDSVGSSDPVQRAKLVRVPLDPTTTVLAAYNPPVPAAAPTGTTATTPADATATTTTPATTTDPTATTADPTATATAPTAGIPLHADADFSGEPKLALDGDLATSWSVNLPTTDLLASPRVGLLVDLATATKLRELTLTPTTPGTTVVVYGATGATAPATLQDKGWKKLATQLDVNGETKITLGDDVTGTGKVRQLLVWFSEGPDDGTSTSVGISELKLYR